MRHDPASGAVVIMLRSLKMFGMAQAVEELVEQGAPAFEAAVPILSQLLKAEVAEREVRSIAYHMKAARFPSYKDLAGFDFAASEVNEALVRQLHRCEFIDGAHNVVLIGGPGTGKTHVATALGVQAVEHHRKKVRFFSTVELVNTLEQEKARGKAGHLAENLTRADLVILDELGYLPFSATGGALLFHLLSKLAGGASGAAEQARRSARGSRATVDFEYFRGWLVEGLGYGDGAKGGRPPFDPVSMFKALILQAQHNLSDARMEFMIRDRLSWMRFLGFDLGAPTPDENTIRHFRNRLTETAR
jgi:DNA replication protein DnaC